MEEIKAYKAIDGKIFFDREESLSYENTLSKQIKFDLIKKAYLKSSEKVELSRLYLGEEIVWKISTKDEFNFIHDDIYCYSDFTDKKFNEKLDLLLKENNPIYIIMRKDYSSDYPDTIEANFDFDDIFTNLVALRSK